MSTSSKIIRKLWVSSLRINNAHPCSILIRTSSLFQESKRSPLSRIVRPSDACAFPLTERSFHLSANRDADDSEKKKKGKRKSKSKDLEKRAVSEDIHKATVEVAKSLPGNWTKTADDLLARLTALENPEQKVQPEETQLDQMDNGSKSLLETMTVGRSFDRSKRKLAQGIKGTQMSDGDPYMPSTTRFKDQSRKRLARKNEVFTDMFSAPRLGIFDAEKVKAHVAAQEKQGMSDKPQDLWSQVEEESYKSAHGGVPRNGFEQMIQWTKEGKLWKFPIDNEADMHEERKYSFHDHVFLEKHLASFPDKGPIRRFMELVLLGLGKNPYLTVDEKIEHIKWFDFYFREKQEILQSSIGDDGKMKDQKNLS